MVLLESFQIQDLSFLILQMDFLFEINVNNISTSSSLNIDTWESGYKYIFESITVYDTVSKTTFKNNQEVIYDYNPSKGSHAAYYLDQFIFIIP